MSLKTFRNLFKAFGWDPLITFRALKALPGFIRDSIRFTYKSRTSQAWPISYTFPCLADRYDSSGVASGHYFHQDLFVAQRIYNNKPVRHIDVGSRVDGLVAHIASFRDVTVIDIRTLEIEIPNIIFMQADLMNSIDFDLENSCDSLSCLHALEHFGLGRYGDKLDPTGYLQGLSNLASILKKNGVLYLSVPIGHQRIEFNAHRVFSVSTLLTDVQKLFFLQMFSYVDDKGFFYPNVKISSNDILHNFGCRYGLALLELKKL